LSVISTTAGTGLVVDDVLNLRVDTVAKVTAMTVAGCQKLARFLGRLGFNAPFLDARYDHIGVEHFPFLFGGSGWHDTSVRINFMGHGTTFRRPEQIGNAAFARLAGTVGL
jgi:hypothetical protein